MSIKSLWDSFHEIPVGAIVPDGTGLAQLDPDDGELSIYNVLGTAEWTGAPEYAPVRSVDPLPDLNDTGLFRVEVSTAAVLVHLGNGGYCTLTKQQARNLARKLTEEPNGH